MKKKLTIKSILFYIVLIAIAIPSFQYASENNSLYWVFSHKISTEEVKTFLKEEYGNGVQLKDYKIEKSMMKIKEEESKPILYYYFITEHSEDEEDLIFEEVRQIYNKMRNQDEINEFFYKVRFRAMNDDQVIYKHTYNMINWTTDRLMYVSLALMLGLAIRLYYGLRAILLAIARKKGLGPDNLDDYSLNELKFYLQSYPKDDRAYMRLSQIYFNQGNIKEALDTIGEANRLNPYERDYVLHYGKILVFIEEYREALGVHNGLVKIKSFFTDYSLLNKVAILYYETGKLKTARRYFKHAYRVCKKRRFRNEPEAQEMKKDLEIILNKKQN